MNDAAAQARSARAQLQGGPTSLGLKAVRAGAGAGRRSGHARALAELAEHERGHRIGRVSLIRVVFDDQTSVHLRRVGGFVSVGVVWMQGVRHVRAHAKGCPSRALVQTLHRLWVQRGGDALDRVRRHRARRAAR